MNRRGASLATTLVFVTLALIVGLALASSSVSHLHFASSQTQRNKARAAADSVLQMAIGHVLEHPEFGQSRNQDASFEVTFEDSVGRISFNQDRAADWNVPYSTNNRQTEEWSQGDLGREVPPEGVHLVAIGHAGGTTKRLETVLHIPDFPYALASAGPIASDGSLFIGGLEDLSNAFPEIDENELEPADLASNASGPAINLDGEARIHGNVQAVGSISLGEEVNIEGEIRPSSDPITVAELNLAEIRPERSLPLAGREGLNLDGSHHVNGGGPTTLTGGLTLNDGILYVDGDLEIRGGLEGRGAILVDGSLHIRGGAALSTDNQVAVVAKGDVTIEQTSSRSSYFQGMVYTEGDFTASDTTLLGSFVANRPGDALNPGSQLSLHNASVVHIPEFSSFETQAKDIVFSLNLGNGDNGWFYDAYEIHLTATAEEWEEFQAWVSEGSADADDDHSNSHLAIRDKLSSLDIHVTNGPNNFTGLVFGSGPENTPLDQLAASFQGAFRSPQGALHGYQSENQIIYEEQLPAFQFDLNEFIDEVDRARIIMWREF